MDSPKYLIGARVGLIGFDGFIYENRGAIVAVTWSAKDEGNKATYDIRWDKGYLSSYVEQLLYPLDNGIDKLKEILDCQQN